MFIIPLALAAACLATPVQEPAPAQETAQEPIRYMGRAFLFAADLEAARAAGWSAADVDEEVLLEGIAASLEMRLRSSGRFVEAHVERDPEARFAVVFVGPQSKTIEDMIVRGLSVAGRVEVGPVATAEDLALAGTSLAQERGRLDAWRAAHPEAPVAWFNGVAREAGGPHEALRWCAWKDGARPTPVLRAGTYRFSRATFTGDKPVTTVVHPEEEDGIAVRVNQDEAGAAALRDTLAPFLGRELATVFDDRVIGVRALADLEGTSFDIVGDLERDELRTLLWGLTAEPFGARLDFIGFDKRELRGVTDKGE